LLFLKEGEGKYLLFVRDYKKGPPSPRFLRYSSLKKRGEDLHGEKRISNVCFGSH